MKKNYENTFQIRPIYKDTYCIVDNAMGGTVNMYLLVGKDKALLIDSGYGDPKLLEAIGSITDKEVICACTHGHIDHALGAYLFENAYVHSADMALYREHCSQEKILDCGLEGIGAKPKKFLKLSGYTEHVQMLSQIRRKILQPLEEVQAFDLGGRTVRWVQVPGHTPGSVAFLDEENKIAFDGDAAPNGLWLFMPEASGVEDFFASAVQYEKALKEKSVLHRYGGHSSVPVPTEQLQTLQRICVKILDKQKQGKRVGIPMHFRVGNARMVTMDRTAIFIK